MNYSNFTINALVAGNNQLHSQFMSAQKQLNQQVMKQQQQQSRSLEGGQFVVPPLKQTPQSLKGPHLNVASGAHHLQSSKQSQEPVPVPMMKLMPPVPGHEWLQPASYVQQAPPPPTHLDMPSTQSLLDAQAFAKGLISAPDFYFKQSAALRPAPQLTIEQLIGVNPLGQAAGASALPSQQTAFQQMSQNFGSYAGTQPIQQQGSHFTIQMNQLNSNEQRPRNMMPPPSLPNNMTQQEQLQQSLAIAQANGKAAHLSSTRAVQIGREASLSKGRRRNRAETTTCNDSTTTRDNIEANPTQQNGASAENTARNANEEDEDDDDEDTGRRRARKSKIPKTVSYNQRLMGRMRSNICSIINN